MQITLNIQAQPSTQNRARKAVLFSCHRDGTIVLECIDGEKPAKITLTATDIFPWDEMLSKLLLNWKLGDIESVPSPFRPTQRIPEYIVEGFEKEPISNKLKILAELRRQGYFPPLSNP
mgnify:CR=1 FL=1